MPEPALSFDFGHLFRLIEQAAQARRLSITTRDKPAALTLGRLAEELDDQISQLACHIVHEQQDTDPEHPSRPTQGGEAGQ